MDSIINFAKGILCMQNELEYLREEVQRLEGIEKKYNDLLNSSLTHSQRMSGQVMELILNKGHFNPERKEA